MIDNSWVIDIEPKIYSIIKAKTEKEIKKKYPDVNFTMDDAVQNDPKFPSIYFHFLQSTEVGEDLEGQSINGIICSVDVRTTVSKTQDLTALRWVNTKILNAFKELRFDARLPKLNDSTVDTKSSTMRFERIIGQGQIL